LKPVLQNWGSNLRNSVTPWSRVILEKMIIAKVVKGIPAFGGTRSFITVFAWACH
jgi:hypothetical protein